MTDDLQKMALKDIKPGKALAPRGNAVGHPPRNFDYSHALPPAARKAGYSLHVSDEMRTGGDHNIHSRLYHRTQGEIPVGGLDAFRLDEDQGPSLAIDVSRLGQSHRGKGLGMAMYEAAMAHAFNVHGIKNLVGDTHSTLADKVHQRLAAKHGFKYRARRHGQTENGGANDDAFGPYGYTLKSEKGGGDRGFGYNDDGYPLEDRYEFQGLSICVENKKGSTRKWYDPNGDESGSTKMRADYGYVDECEGADGEPVDVYVGPDTDAKMVYVVHQQKAPDFKEYDEDKVMLGFPSEEAARDLYLRQYDDERFYGGMSSMPVETFKEKLCDGGKITSKSELQKGAMKRLAPFRPDPNMDIGGTRDWQMGWGSRDDVPAMTGPARVRALHKLGAATQIRRGASGEREFLLHRGMSDDERKGTVKGDSVSHSARSSWTPHQDIAWDFHRHHYIGPSNIVSAWIPESAIHSVPKQLGRLNLWDPIFARVLPGGKNEMDNEHEVIVAPHKSQLMKSDELRKSPLAYDPPPEWAQALTTENPRWVYSARRSGPAIPVGENLYMHPLAYRGFKAFFLTPSQTFSHEAPALAVAHGASNRRSRDWDSKGNKISVEPHYSVHALAVHPLHAGKGYGRLLLREIARRYGTVRTEGTVSAQATKAFQQLGREPGFSVEMGKISPHRSYTEGGNDLEAQDQPHVLRHKKSEQDLQDPQLEADLESTMADESGTVGAVNALPALVSALTAAVPAAQVATWSPRGLHQELLPVAQLESSFGRQMNHPQDSRGPWHTALGALGLKPATAHERYLQSPSLQKLYPGLTGPETFFQRLSSDPLFYNLMAGAHWLYLRKQLGSADRAAYGWRWGLTAAKDRIDPEHDPYVIKYKAFLAAVQKGEVRKAEGGTDAQKLLTSDEDGDRLLGMRVLAFPSEIDAYLDAGKLRNCETQAVVEALLSRDDLTGEQLHRLMEFCPETCRPAVLRHKNADDSHVSEVLKRPQPPVDDLRAAVTHPHVRPDQVLLALDLARAAGQPLPEALPYFGRPDMPSGEVSRYVESICDPSATAPWLTEALAPVLAHHPNLSLRDFEAVLQNRQHPCRPHVLTRKMSQMELLRYAADPRLNNSFSPEDARTVLAAQGPLSPAVVKAFSARGMARDSNGGEPAPDFKKALQDWLPLQKMAVKPEDLKGIARATTPEGPNLVDHRPHMESHPELHQHLVNDYRQNVLGGDYVRTRQSTRGLGQGITRKLIYRLGEDESKGRTEEHRFMVKPYHEAVSRRLRNWMQHPIQGWAEMTTQGMFHAAGIGDLHQKVHVSEHPVEASPAFPEPTELWRKQWAEENGVGPLRLTPEQSKSWKKYRDERAAGTPWGRKKSNEPMLVVHLERGYEPVYGGVDSMPTKEKDEKVEEQARKIALMDFLANNLDRHGGNLLFNRETGNLLAIDHSRNFQYRNTRKGQAPNRWVTPPTENLGTYMGYGHHSAIADILPHPYFRRSDPDYMDRVDKHREGFEKTIEEWWPTVSKRVRAEVQKHLQSIKDPEVRAHVARNFERRADHLDEMAEMGVGNYGRDEWDRAEVPLYRYGTRDHDE